MSTLDQIIIINVLANFILFVITHFTIFRFTKDDNILEGTINIFILVAIFQLLSFFGLWNIHPELSGNNNLGHIIFCAALSLIQFGFLSFFYILLVFGPYETSIRLRIIRELHKVYPKTVTYKGLLSKYDNEAILKKRLTRLIKNGDLTEADNVYRINHRHSPFFLIDACSTLLRKLTQGPKE